jgi:uncharacterized protein (DUF2141 family)
MKVVILASIAVLAVAAPAYAAPLNVQVEGVRAAQGPLYVSVQTREQFMQPQGVAGDVVPAPQAGSLRFTYELPAGEYAVSAWHDDNGNGRFDSNEQHIPLDGWAMVNGDRIRAEPTFDEVRTVIGIEAVTVRLSMTYGR